jgi:hypothetical protein
MKPKKGPKPTTDRVEKRSDLPPLPYYPNLKLVLKSVTAALVLTYLEIHHPAPERPPGARPSMSSLPITLSIDDAAAALCITRRTLYVSLSVLSARWKTEESRAGAARANREFRVPQHSVYDPNKPYSLTGSLTHDSGTTYQLRRNLPHITRLLAQAGFDPAVTLTLPPILRNGAPAALPPSAYSESLKDLLTRASVLDQDRRTVRYQRLNAGIQRGLTGPEAIKVKRTKSRVSKAAKPSSNAS